jgi:glycosyltransferase involved in cell wall biosynthesis
MVDRFNAVADRGDVDFEVWFCKYSYGDYDWDLDESEWRFSYRYLKTLTLPGLTLHWPPPLWRIRPDLLITLYAQPVFLCGLALARFRGIKTALWVEVTFDSMVNRGRIKEFIKRHLFPAADAILTVADDGKEFAARYGARPRDIFYLPHVIDYYFYKSRSDALRIKREALRRKYNVEGVTFIFVGRIWEHKGIAFLLEAYQLVQRDSGTPITLLMVGDGPDMARFQQQTIELGLHNVIFTGFMQKQELPLYYTLADIFVFPSLGEPYGMVVDEAMACSLPIITTSAIGEIRNRVQQGENGYIVPPEDSPALAKRMAQLAHDDQLRKQMAEVSPEKIKKRTPDYWAQTFSDISNNIVSGPTSP